MAENSPYVMVSTNYGANIAATMKLQKGNFVNAFLEIKKAELGAEKFDKQKAKLEKYAGECWERAQEGKRRFRELEELSGRRIMEWKDLEKPLRQWLENDMVGNRWGQDAVELTIKSYHRDFERNQNHVKGRLRRIRDPDADFRKRVLNPETREAAIKKYTHDHVNWRYYTTMAFNILFEELEKRRR